MAKIAIARTSVDSEAIENAAARWIVKRESGTWTQTDQAELDAWLEAATAHRIQYLRIGATWTRAARLKAFVTGTVASVAPARNSWGDSRFLRGTLAGRNSQEPRRTASRATRSRYAAVVAAVGVLAAGIYLSRDLVVADGYSTPVGGLDTFALNDGSQVTLNTNSRIQVALRDRERRVSLKEGEAFFEVAKDPARPFVVEVGNKRVVAVGTRFSVRRDGDDIRVVVTEGLVRVETNGPQAGPSPHAVMLRAGSVARTSKEEVLVRRQAPPEAEKLLSWRGGYVSFEEMALADAVAEFNRYNTRRIVIADPRIATLRLSGKFRSNNTEAFLWLIQSGFPVAVEQHDDEVVLKAR